MCDDIYFILKFWMVLPLQCLYVPFIDAVREQHVAGNDSSFEIEIIIDKLLPL